ncbi:winged helix-turn-helix domain-containing protein [Roseobacter sinensis]|uniref:Winged helix-turn-helix domain-containing protein n=1 Tax=Roseobacter sinensis TaxID=2931391 RepID=A0ABT3BIG0_9RHOB|nr:winged helix-turn-helix domain-containing protein [Roseobacter sp. WL0113]MCV3273366.1 winged helix-turn-helix domain-containing protein [Roseobacter sp. WL0113]
MAILCMLCLMGAGILLVLPDPWAKAERRAAQDAAALADLIATPDKISWRLIDDVPLLRAMVWDADGARHYPPPQGMAPLPYEFSDEAERQLVSFQATVDAVAWAPFDTAGRQLLYCGAVPAVCLVYDRVLLEEALGLRAGALAAKQSKGSLAILLAALSCLFGGYGLWLGQRPKEAGPAFKIVPERHIAIRDTLEISLTPRDLKLLSILQDRDGAVVTKDELYDAGWGRDYMPNSRSLDQHIINLRRKLDPDKSRPVLIETVHGVGYRLVN